MSERETNGNAQALEEMLGLKFDEDRVNVLPVIVFVVDMDQYEELAVSGPEN